MTITGIRDTRVVDIEYKKKGGEVVRDEYTITQLNASSGIKYMKKVQKVVLPVWAEASKSDNVTMADILIKASEKLEEIDEKDIVSLICESLNITQSQFDTKFLGKNVVMFKLLKEIIMFNFEDVFQELGLEEI